MVVKIYSTQTCIWCQKAKEWMQEHKIKFKDVDVGKNMKARAEMFKKTGQMGVPVIDANGTIIIGFDESALRKALKVK